MMKCFLIIILLITNIYGQINRTNGDINDDGEINVADIVTLVSYILDDTVNVNGDLNQDGSLDILDVILLVDIILNPIPESGLFINQQYQEDSRMLKRSLLFKYEDFTSKPHEVLLQVSEFLDESLELPKEWEVKRGVNQKYLDMWEHYRNSFWTKRKAQKLILKYEDSFNAFGYSLK